MDENQPQAPKTQPMPVNEDKVAFPTPPGSSSDGRKSKNTSVIKWVVAGVGVLAIVVIGAIFVLSPPPEEAVESQEETQDGSVLQAVATPEPTPEPSPTPTPVPVEKSEVSIQVLNGTGTPGDASLVSSELEEIGFEDILAANADEQEETSTTLTYSPDMPQNIVTQIREVLEEIFGRVNLTQGVQDDEYDIIILTGPKAQEEETQANSDETQSDPTDTAADDPKDQESN